MDDTMLRILVDLREAMQKQRIAFGNRVGALERAADTGNGESVAAMERWHERFVEVEKRAGDDIRDAVKEYPIYDYLIRVKGVGPMLAAQLIALIDIERANTVSALWRYAGYAVINGQRERPTKGEKLHYNARLKKVCFLLAESFLKSNSPYRAVYDDGRAYYEANRPEWTKARRHMAAMRRMIKQFLAHLWQVWRELERLPTRALYVEERLGHEHVTSPADYGWYGAPEGNGNGDGRTRDGRTRPEKRARPSRAREQAAVA